MLDLKGINAKISRARENLRTLEADMAAFCEYERRRHVFTAEQGWPRLVGDNRAELPTSYAIRVGEIAYHLRSALDHLVWQLVEYNGEPPGSKNKFPIFIDENKYQKSIKKDLKGMKERHIRVVELFQPFREKTGVGQHLWMLNLIGNIDKHRHLTVFALHSVTGPHSEGDTDQVVESITDICFVDEKLEAASPRYGSKIESTGIKRPPVIQVLHGCLTAVQFVVDTFNGGFLTGEVGEALERKGQESE